MSLNNDKRKRARNKFPQPKVPATRTLKLDNYVPATSKTELAKI